MPARNLQRAFFAGLTVLAAVFGSSSCKPRPGNSRAEVAREYSRLPDANAKRQFAIDRINDETIAVGKPLESLTALFGPDFSAAGYGDNGPTTGDVFFAPRPNSGDPQVQANPTGWYLGFGLRDGRISNYSLSNYNYSRPKVLSDSMDLTPLGREYSGLSTPLARLAFCVRCIDDGIIVAGTHEDDVKMLFGSDATIELGVDGHSNMTVYFSKQTGDRKGWRLAAPVWNKRLRAYYLTNVAKESK